MRELIPLRVRQLVGNFLNERAVQVQQRRLLRALRGNAVECNVCRWTGARFADDSWHPGTVCPVCRSQVRHRMFAAMLDGLAGRENDERSLIAGKEVLHFAPERQLRFRIEKLSARYITADFDRGDCDLRLDMSDMPSVPDDSFDTVIACDVLEHVPDDRAAMCELRRVLREGGTAILTVPQKDPPSTTDEDPSVTAEAEREKRFGQKDHMRMFGDDFEERLIAAGFAVNAVSASEFSGDAVARHVLAPPKPNSHPLATNRRRLYVSTALPRLR